MNVLFILLAVLPVIHSGGESLPEAQRLVDAGQYDAAKGILEQRVARDGADADARMLLGKVLSRHYQKFDDAQKQMEKAVELAGGKADFHFQLGMLYGTQAQRGNAFSKLSYARKVKTQFERAVELAPDSLRYRVALINFHLRAPGVAGGSVGKAREQAGELLKRDPFEGRMALAAIAEHDKDDVAAEQEYLAAVAANATAWRPHHRLGYLYLGMHRVDDAITQFTFYVEKAPDDPNAYDSLAEGYVARGDSNAAFENYLKALERNPAFASSLYGAGRSCDDMGRKQEAVQYYGKFLATNPKGDNADRAKERMWALSARK